MQARLGLSMQNNLTLVYLHVVCMYNIFIIMEISVYFGHSPLIDFVTWDDHIKEVIFLIINFQG